MKITKELIQRITNNDPSLKELNCYNNTINTNNIQLFREFIKALKKNHTIETLHLHCNFSNNLDSFKLTSDSIEFFDALGKNTKIKKLKLNLGGQYFGNPRVIEAFGKAIEENNTIEDMDLSGYYLLLPPQSTQTLIELFDALGKNTKIKKLNLGSQTSHLIKSPNIFKALVKAIQNMTLEYLKIGITTDISKKESIESLIELFNILGDDTSIQSLRLKVQNSTSHEVSSAISEAFAKAFIKNNTLKSFDLSDSTLERAPQIVKALGEIFRKNNILQSVDLSRNRFCDIDSKNLWNGLDNNTSIKELNLSSIGDSSFAQIFKQNNTIEDLNLSNNGSTKGMDLEAFLYNLESSNNTSLKKLNTSNNQFRDKPKSMIALVHFLKKNTTIEDLILGAISSEHKSLIDFCSEIGKVKNLKKLSLSGGTIYQPKPFAVLTESLRKNNTIEELNLYGCLNSYYKSNLQEFFFNLGNNTSIKKLNLGFESANVSTTDLKTVEALADAIERNSTLKHLNLMYTRFSLEQLKLIADAVEKNFSLIEMPTPISVYNESPHLDRISSYLKRNRSLSKSKNTTKINEMEELKDDSKEQQNTTQLTTLNYNLEPNLKSQPIPSAPPNIINPKIIDTRVEGELDIELEGKEDTNQQPNSSTNVVSNSNVVQSNEEKKENKPQCCVIL